MYQYHVSRFQRAVIWLIVINQVFLPVFSVFDHVNQVRAQDAAVESTNSIASAPAPSGYQPPAQISIWDETESTTPQAGKMALAEQPLMQAQSAAPQTSAAPGDMYLVGPVAPFPMGKGFISNDGQKIAYLCPQAIAGYSYWDDVCLSDFTDTPTYNMSNEIRLTTSTRSTNYNETIESLAGWTPDGRALMWLKTSYVSPEPGYFTSTITKTLWRYDFSADYSTGTLSEITLPIDMNGITQVYWGRDEAFYIVWQEPPVPDLVNPQYWHPYVYDPVRHAEISKVVDGELVVVVSTAVEDFEPTFFEMDHIHKFPDRRYEEIFRVKDVNAHGDILFDYAVELYQRYFFGGSYGYSKNYSRPPLLFWQSRDGFERYVVSKPNGSMNTAAAFGATDNEIYWVHEGYYGSNTGVLFRTNVRDLRSGLPTNTELGVGEGEWPYITSIPSGYNFIFDILYLGEHHTEESEPISGTAIMGFGDARSPDASFNTVIGSQASVGKPINPLTGNYTYAKEDLSVFAQGQTLSFQRVYSTLRQLEWSDEVEAGAEEMMGPGWTHTYNLRLLFEDLGGIPQTITFQQAYGSQQEFKWDTATLTYKADPGLVADLVRTVDQGVVSFTVTTPTDHTVYKFDNKGYIKQIYPGGNNLTPIKFEYDPTSCLTVCRLVRVEMGTNDTGKRLLHLEYYGANEITTIDGSLVTQPKGYLKEVSDQAGHSVHYSYKPQSVTLHGQPVLFDPFRKYELIEVKDAKDQPWRYVYEEASPYFLTRVTDPLGNVLEEQEYDDGRVVDQWQGFGQEEGNAGYKREKIAHFDYLGERAELTGTETTVFITDVTDGQGNVYRYVPDDNGTLANISDRTGLAEDDPEGRLISGTSYSAEYNYRLTSQTDEYGNVTTFGWDGPAQFNQITDALDNVTDVTYDNGVPTHIFDPRNRETEIEYLSPLPTLPSKITETSSTFPTPAQPESHVTTMSYEGHALISEVTNALGQKTKYEYDALGLVTKVTANYQDGVFDSQFPDQDLITQYVYDTTGRVTQVINPLNLVTKTTYDSAGNVTEVVQNFVDGNYSASEPDKDIKTVMTYDNGGRLETKTDTLGRTTKYVYDFAGRVIQVIAHYQPLVNNGNFDPSMPAVNVDVEYAYDKNGNVISSKDAFGRVDRTCYDSRNRPVRTVANYMAAAESPEDYPCKMALGIASDTNLITDISYGVDRNVRRYTDMTHYLKKPDGSVQATITRTVYDKLNRPIFVIYNYQDGVHKFPDGRLVPYESASGVDPDDQDIIVQTEYDAVGNVLKTIDPMGRETWMCYDSFSRLTKTVQNVSDKSQTPDALCASSPTSSSDANLITRFEYDFLGRVLVSYDTTNRATHYEYDQLGRVTKTISNYQDGVFNPTSPDADVTRMITYDPAGLWTETREFKVAITEPITAAQYRATRTVYDLLGRQTAVIGNYKDGIFNPAEPDVDVIQKTKYDGMGSVLQQISPNDDSDPETGYITQFGYDALGRLTSVTDPANNQLTSVYNAIGQLERIEDAFGQKTYFLYDGMGRQTQTWTDLTVSSPTFTYYDQLGQMTFKTDAEGITTAFIYDKLGRAKEVIENATLPLNTTSFNTSGPSSNVRTAYSYNVMGSLTRVDLPNSNVITYEYDGLERQVKVDSVLPGVDNWTTAYDPAGRVSTVTDPTGRVKTFGYDGVDRLTGISYSYTGSEPTPPPAMNSEVFTYDALGRQMTAGAVSTQPTTYTYDELDRIKTVKDPFQKTISYAYYAAGTLKTKTLPNAGTVTYNYDGANQLASIQGWGTTNTSYEYDKTHLKSMTLPNGVKAEFTYDTDNRMKTVTYKQGTQTLMYYSYDYDKVGNRVAAEEQIVEAPSMAVSSFTLVNADTGADIRQLTSNDVIDPSTLPTMNLSIRANTVAPGGETVNSVKFSVDGSNSGSTDSTSVFAIAGNTSSGAYQPWAWKSGKHTVKAVPYDGTQGNGLPGKSLTMSLEIRTPACTRTVNPNDVASLVSNITAANSNANPDVLCLSGNYDFATGTVNSVGYNALPLITTDITIVGGVIYRSGTAKYRLFKIEAAGKLKLIDSYVGGGDAGTNNGGAIYINGGQLTLINTQLPQNVAANGGAIYNTNGTLTVIGSDIYFNDATAQGGGIYSNTTKSVTITNSYFSYDTAGTMGGAIAAYSPVTITASTFQLNTAKQSGGGVYLSTSSTVASTITASFFAQNSITPTTGTSLSGGALSLNPAKTNIVDSQFVNNQIVNNGNVANYGIAIYMGSSVVTMTNDVVYGNWIIRDVFVENPNPAGGGGGIFINGTSVLTLNTSYVAGNNADARGGGIYNNNATLVMDNSTLEGNGPTNYNANSDGGGIYQVGTASKLTITDSVINNNYAADQGGGVYYAAGTVKSVTHSCLIDNSATTGPAIYSAVAFTATGNWWGTSAGAGTAVNSLVNATSPVTTSCPTDVGAPPALISLLFGGSSLSAASAMKSDAALTDDKPSRPSEAETDEDYALALPFSDNFEENLFWNAESLWRSELGDSGLDWTADSLIRDEISTLTLIKPLDLTTAAQPKMHFWRKADLSSADMLVAEASTDGTNWTPVHTETNVHSDWMEQVVDLAAFKGQIVRLRFTILTAGDVSAGEFSEGYHIDNLSIVDAANGAIVTETPEATLEATVEVTSEATLEATVAVTPEATLEVTETPIPTATDDVVVPVAPTPLPAGSYEETETGIRYAGSWSSYAENGLSYIRSTTPHDRMAFTFTGAELVVYRAIGPSFGTMEVCFDLVCQTVSNENAEVVEEAGIPFSVPAGLHQAEVRVGESGDLRVNRIEVKDGLIVDPTLVTDVPVTAEPTLTQEVTATPEATLPIDVPVLTFEATVLPETVEPVMTVESLPLAQQPVVVVEQTVEQPVVVEQAAEIVEQPVEAVPVLTAEVTTVPVVVETEATVEVPTVVTDAPVVIDPVVVVTEATEAPVIVVPVTEATLIPTEAPTDVIVPTNTGPLTAGSYEETDANIRYAGSWAAYTENGLSYIRSTTPHDRMAFTFAGAELVVYRAIGPSFGTMEVCFDLVCQTVSNENAEVVEEAGIPFSVPAGVHQAEVRVGESGDLRVNRVEVRDVPAVETPAPTVVPVKMDAISYQQIIEQSTQMIAETGGEAPFASSQMGVMSAGVLTSRYITYDYDELYRLTNATTYSDAAHTAQIDSYTYTYDLLGNRTSQTVKSPDTNNQDQLTQYIYTGTQLTSEVRPGSGGTYNYSYYANGNRKDVTSGSQTWSYTYDLASRLTGYSTPTGAYSYTYNGMGDRLSQTVGGIPTQYLLDLNGSLSQVVGEYTNGNGTFYLDGVGQYQYQSPYMGGKWSYYGYDGLGSVRQMTNPTGGVTYSTNYDPYGNPLKSKGLSSPFGFTGEQTDPSGLVYLRARYYDPVAGVFLSTDPVAGVVGGPSIRWNPYAYAGANPANYVDPDGQFFFLAAMAVAAGSAVFGWDLYVTKGYGRGGYNEGKLIPLGSFVDSGLKGVGAGAVTLVSGGVGSLASAITIGALGITAGSGTLATVGAFAASEVVGGGVGRITANVLTGQSILKDVFDPGEILRDAVTGGITGGILKGAQSMLPEGSRWSAAVDEMLGGAPESQCPHSFAADTDVATSDGPIDISEIEIGDEVFAFNEETGELGLYPVTATFEHLDPVIFELTIDDETITTTPGHLFYTNQGTWVKAEDLVVGDIIRTLDGGSGTVTAIETVAAQQWMYDLTVDEAHTFAVGEGAWVVHNCPQLHLGDADGGDDFDPLRPDPGNASNRSGAYGEERLKALYPNAQKQSVTTPSGEGRNWDGYDPNTKTAYEAKAGTQPYFKEPERVFGEVKKDAELLNAGVVAAVEWHFFPSPDGKPPRVAQDLIDALNAAGIPYFIHPK